MSKQLGHRVKYFAIAMTYAVCVIVGSHAYTSKAEDDIVITKTVSYGPKIEEIKEEVAEEPPVIEPEVIPEIEEELPVLYFDVPLEKDLQDHIFALCEERGVDPAIIVAMIGRESRYRAGIKGDHGRSYGLMQIQPKWHQKRANELGYPDLMNPYHNVAVGIDILGDFLESGNGIEWALMAYNGGAAYANRKAAKGEVNTYAKSVISKSKELYGGLQND